MPVPRWTSVDGPGYQASVDDSFYSAPWTPQSTREWMQTIPYIEHEPMPGGGGPMGWYMPFPDSSREIVTTDISDQNTFWHEYGHAAWDELLSDRQRIAYPLAWQHYMAQPYSQHRENFALQLASPQERYAYMAGQSLGNRFLVPENLRSYFNWIGQPDRSVYLK